MLKNLPTNVMKALLKIQHGKSTTLQLPKQTFAATLSSDTVITDICTSLLNMDNGARLNKIVLGRNQLNDRSTVPLGQLLTRSDGHLDVMSVANNNLSGEGIRNLVQDALQSSYVTVLNVDGNPGMIDPTIKELVQGPLASHLQINRQSRQNRQKEIDGHQKKKRARLNSINTSTSSASSATSSTTTTRKKTAPFHVAIVGGGVGGLALALALHAKKISCTVFERDTSFNQRQQGYGLTLQQGGRAMRALNVASDIADRGAWSSRHFIFNHLGEVIAFWGPTYTDESKTLHPNVPLGQDPSFDRISRMGRHNIHIARQALRGVLHEACVDRLPTDALQWGYKLDHVEMNNEQTKNQPDVNGNAVDGNEEVVLKVNEVNEVNEVDVKGVNEKEKKTESTSTNTSSFSSSSFSSASSPCTLHFQSQQAPFHADLVVGCDGIHSSMRQQFVGDPMIYLDLFVMLGIFDVDNNNNNIDRDISLNDIYDENKNLDLLKERVLQMSNGSTRMFIMPFSATQSMWQLTFPATEEESKAINQGGAASLMKAAKSKCEGWSYPVPNILERTSLDLISGYPVYDRNPMDVKKNVNEDVRDEINMPASVPCTLIGDAAHCMSPLKGQGANQALLDAVELADVLEKVVALRSEPDLKQEEEQEQEQNQEQKDHYNHHVLCSALRTFENEMTERTTSKVLASRDACVILHSLDFLSPEWQLKRKSMVTDMPIRLQRMKDNGINASSTPSDLDKYGFLIGGELKVKPILSVKKDGKK